MSDNIKANIDGVYLLRHEYGHTIQLKELGVIGYTLFVVTPSVNGFQKQAKNKLTIDYYSQPWEFEADLYGKVPTRDSYDPYVWDWLIDYRSYRSCFFDR